MGHWTHFEEDAFRLPEGMKRIAYDADTKRYTFRDSHGVLYQGAPEEDYGTLTPMSDVGLDSRPGAFESDGPVPKPLFINPDAAPSTFHDILPANLITSPSSSKDARNKSMWSPTSSKATGEGDRSAPRARFNGAVWKAALPKMKGVADSLRRSVTPARRKSSPGTEEAQNSSPGGSANNNPTSISSKSPVSTNSK
ncbi:hypothetical protein Hypma_001393 [Hypsizygus marmoreus]|uniref:Carbohydrate-binding module family 50 protein n=1 Tax=Hypsizygus marmoreus TaxID=39966 RepID=A0A369K0K9_HYPMA|nr:hypothetical protein Hypma_001393 [Hypsizygus marmoreus]